MRKLLGILMAGTVAVLGATGAMAQDKLKVGFVYVGPVDDFAAGGTEYHGIDSTFSTSARLLPPVESPRRRITRSGLRRFTSITARFNESSSSPGRPVGSPNTAIVSNRSACGVVRGV